MTVWFQAARGTFTSSTGDHKVITSLTDTNKSWNKVN
jgi:hypothetical protein